MTESSEKPETPTTLKKAVAVKRRRRLAARRRPDRTIWFGLGMFGLVGWSVAIPTLIGVALGLWIDHRWPSQYSWTLMLMLAGVALGCLNAWRWVRREGRWDQPNMTDEQDERIATQPSINDLHGEDQAVSGESLDDPSKPPVADDEEVP